MINNKHVVVSACISLSQLLQNFHSVHIMVATTTPIRSSLDMQCSSTNSHSSCHQGIRTNAHAYCNDNTSSFNNVEACYHINITIFITVEAFLPILLSTLAFNAPLLCISYLSKYLHLSNVHKLTMTIIFRVLYFRMPLS